MSRPTTVAGDSDARGVHRWQSTDPRSDRRRMRASATARRARPCCPERSRQRVRRSLVPGVSEDSPERELDRAADDLMRAVRMSGAPYVGLFGWAGGRIRRTIGPAAPVVDSGAVEGRFQRVVSRTPRTGAGGGSIRPLGRMAERDRVTDEDALGRKGSNGTRLLAGGLTYGARAVSRGATIDPAHPAGRGGAGHAHSSFAGIEPSTTQTHEADDGDGGCQVAAGSHDDRRSESDAGCGKPVRGRLDNAGWSAVAATHDGYRREAGQEACGQVQRTPHRGDRHRYIAGRREAEGGRWGEGLEPGGACPSRRQSRLRPPRDRRSGERAVRCVSRAARRDEAGGS